MRPFIDNLVNWPISRHALIECGVDSYSSNPTIAVCKNKKAPNIAVESFLDNLVSWPHALIKCGVDRYASNLTIAVYKNKKAPNIAVESFLDNLVSWPISRRALIKRGVGSYSSRPAIAVYKNKKAPNITVESFLDNLVSWPISRVLSWTVIHLGLQSLAGSSDLPGSNASSAIRNPIWSCFG